MILYNDIYRFWILWLQIVCLIPHVISFHQNYSYVLCFMENDAGTLTRDDTSIFVMNPTNDTVHVSVSRINASFALFPGTAEMLLVQGELYHVIGSGIQDKGIHIQSNGSIAVEGMNRIKGSTDVFIVRPTNLLSNEYIVVTYCNGSRACQVAIVATNDDTAITIYFPYEVDLIMENGYSYTYGPNRNLPVVLQAHEVYQIQSGSDLTGVVVISNFPLACFAGANQTTYQLDGNMDHIVDALPPTQAWGYDYIFASNLLTGSNDIVKIIATEDNTFVSVDSCTHATFYLNRAFDYLEDSVTCGGYAIQSNFKIVVAHIRIRPNPGMYFPFPTNNFAQFYFVYVPDKIVGPQTNSLVIYVRTSDVNNIVLNGTLLSGSTWDPIPNTEWRYTSVDVESGLLDIYNNLNRPFGGHLLVRNSFKLSVTNLIPVPYNESDPVCCEHLEYKIGSMMSTEGSGAHVTQGVSMETTASDIATTEPFSTSTTNAKTSSLINSISETTSSTTPVYTQSTGITSQNCCVCVNSTKTGRVWTLQELRELTMINKKNTSIAIRKLTSAHDDRMSAMGLGYCGIAVLCTVLASIMSIDLSRYLCKSSKVSPKKQNC